MDMSSSACLWRNYQSASLKASSSVLISSVAQRHGNAVTSHVQGYTLGQCTCQSITHTKHDKAAQSELLDVHYCFHLIATCQSQLHLWADYPLQLLFHLSTLLTWLCARQHHRVPHSACSCPSPPQQPSPGAQLLHPEPLHHDAVVCQHKQYLADMYAMAAGINDHQCMPGLRIPQCKCRSIWLSNIMPT